jgi:hypothetical protein
MNLTVTFYQENGMAYIIDDLGWEYNTEVPPQPKAYFSEEATSDQGVFLIFNRKSVSNVEEAWIEGDLDESFTPAGAYYALPTDDQVILKLSAADGLKTIKVKYSNVFGTEGPELILTILKKSTAPANCSAVAVSPKTGSGFTRIRVGAVNDGPLYYKIIGDVDPLKDYTEFAGPTEDVWVTLTAGDGNKNLVAYIRDVAGNVCEPIPISVEMVTGWVPGAVSIQDNPIWTDNPVVTVLPQFDHFEGDDVTMYISGGVIAGSNTFQWIPYAETVDVTLSPAEGTRHVIVSYKKDGSQVSEVTTSVFLRPNIYANSLGGLSYNIVPSDIIGMTSMTISGCVESYVNVPFSAALSCTKSAAAVTATYYFSDGTSVTRSVSF